jgi:hypothetical protein
MYVQRFCTIIIACWGVHVLNNITRRFGQLTVSKHFKSIYNSVGTNILCYAALLIGLLRIWSVQISMFLRITASVIMFRSCSLTLTCILYSLFRSLIHRWLLHTLASPLLKLLLWHLLYSSMGYDCIVNVQLWQLCTEGGGLGGSTPLPKFRSFNKAEPNSLFRGKYIRNCLVFIYHHPNYFKNCWT